MITFIVGVIVGDIIMATYFTIQSTRYSTFNDLVILLLTESVKHGYSDLNIVEFLNLLELGSIDVSLDKVEKRFVLNKDRKKK